MATNETALAPIEPSMPAPPSTSEWKMMREQAALLAKSDFVPKDYRGKPDDVLICMTHGRDLGLTGTVALKHINVINGRPGLSAEIMRALIRRQGHKLDIPELTDKKCRMVARRRDTGEVFDVTYTIDMARRAGLLSNAVYGKHTEAMLLARCTSLVARAGFSDVLAGMTHTPEELLQIADTQGETEIRRIPAPVAAEDRDDVVAEAVSGELLDDRADPDDAGGGAADTPNEDVRPLTQGERDELKSWFASVEDARTAAREAIEAIGVWDSDQMEWVPLEGAAKFAHLTTRHRDWIKERV